MSHGTWGHTETARIWIPETFIKQIKPEYTFQALRGYAHTLAVFENSTCVGWVNVTRLGFDTVKDWLNNRLT